MMHVDIPKKVVLIAGGSGLVGKALSQRLQEKGYEVRILTRNINQKSKYLLYHWDLDKNEMDSSAMANIDFLINLSGENISAKRWTKKQKAKILDSRVHSTQFLYKSILETKTQLKAFVSAGAVGYYGTFTSNKVFVETSNAGSDFLAKTCAQWEDAAFYFEKLNVRTVVLRTGVVFSKKGGAFPKMTTSLGLGIFPVLGNGRQAIPWIHIHDLVEMYCQALENEDMKATYNAVAPQAVNYQLLTKEIRKRQFILPFPSIPAFLLKFILGEMASVLLYGSVVSSKKIEELPFNFRFAQISDALDELLTR